MKTSEKINLIEKFWKGETTRKEDEELFSDLRNEDLTSQDDAYFRYLSQMRKVNFIDENNIWNNIVAREQRKKKYIFFSAGIAASLLLFVSIFIIYHTVSLNDNFENHLASITPEDFNTKIGTDYYCDLTLYINGCKSSSDYQTILQTINPKCIQQINMIDDARSTGKKENKKGRIEVWLKGKSDEIFSICEGTLYFYQDGEIKSIAIDDKCSPGLLIDCNEKPLSDIKNMKPQQIKSIELTSNPRNCKGKMDGEFIVMETK